MPGDGRFDIRMMSMRRAAGSHRRTAVMARKYQGRSIERIDASSWFAMQLRCACKSRMTRSTRPAPGPDSRLLRSKEFTALGQGTARTQAVLETVAARWAT